MYCTTEEEYSEIKAKVKLENVKTKKTGENLKKMKAAELCALISGDKKSLKNKSNSSEVKRNQKELTRLRQIERKYNGIKEVFEKKPVDVARISAFLV